MSEGTDLAVVRQMVKVLRRLKEQDVHDGRESLLQKVRRWQRLSLPELPLEQVEHCLRWRELFAEMREQLISVEGKIEIEHIGSSSIPGLRSKAIIDLAIAIEPAARPVVEERLATLDFDPYGAGPGSPDVLWFWKLNHPECAFAVHLCGADDPWWQNALDFRDYLCVHPAEARRYEERKVALASSEPNALLYSLGKIEILLEINRQAREWRATGESDG